MITIKKTTKKQAAENAAKMKEAAKHLKEAFNLTNHHEQTN